MAEARKGGAPLRREADRPGGAALETDRGLRLQPVSEPPDSAGAFGQGALHLCRTSRENRLQVRSTRSRPGLAPVWADRRILRGFGSTRSEGAAGGGSLRPDAERPDLGPIPAGSRVPSLPAEGGRRKLASSLGRAAGPRSGRGEDRGSPRSGPKVDRSGLRLGPNHEGGTADLAPPRRSGRAFGPARQARDGARSVLSQGNRKGLGPEGTHRIGGSLLPLLRTGNRLGFGLDGDPPGKWTSLVSSITGKPG